MTIRTTSIVLLGSLLAGCSVPAPVEPQASSAAVCEALQPSFPIGYHGGYRGVGGDTLDTIARVRVANARFAAACR
ncbi:MAG: hypothetical protein JSR91_18670 [Proteobacteria bacterium]|nr:hypothetical protein [Pseudomonadota bacterium]